MYNCTLVLFTWEIHYEYARHHHFSVMESILTIDIIEVKYTRTVEAKFSLLIVQVLLSMM